MITIEADIIDTYNYDLLNDLSNIDNDLKDVIHALGVINDYLDIDPINNDEDRLKLIYDHTTQYALFKILVDKLTDLQQELQELMTLNNKRYHNENN